jgi:hypothetical protein
MQAAAAESEKYALVPKGTGGLKLGSGGGLRLGGAAVDDWSAQVDRGIADAANYTGGEDFAAAVAAGPNAKARAWANLDGATAKVWTQEDADAAARSQAATAEQNARADAYAKDRARQAVRASRMTPDNMTPDQMAATYAAYGSRSSLANMPSAVAAPVAGHDNSGSGEFDSLVNGNAGANPSASLSDGGAQVGKLGVGAAELLYAGIRNETVRALGGFTSWGVLATDGLDGAVQYQQAFIDRYNYEPRSEGAQMIGQGMVPIAQGAREGLQWVRGQSELSLGDGWTTALGAGLEFGLEAWGAGTGLRSLGPAFDAATALTARGLDNLAAADRLNPQFGGLRVDWSGEVVNVATETGGKVPVQLYDVMTYGESRAGAVVGDKLTGDHIPSFAAVRDNVEAILDRPLTRAEESALRDNTNTVVIGQDLHEAGRTYFGANTPTQIAQDATDLSAAALRDQAVHLQNAPSLRYNSLSLQASFDRINQMSTELFTQFSTRQSTLDWFKSLGL